MKACEGCGAEIVRHRKPNGRLIDPAKYARQRFCSEPCRQAHRRRGAVPEERTCETCGAVFTRSPHRGYWQFSRQRFCSRRCYFRSIKRPRYRSLQHLLKQKTRRPK